MRNKDNIYYKNGIRFKKSSYSPKGQYCVAVSKSKNHIFLTDTKEPNALILNFTIPEWKAFILGVKSGEFDI
jgi:hypothetical protein